MPRQSRPVIPNIPLHITQRGNNRLQCFFCDADFLVYLDLLAKSARESCCQIHAFVLMTNHVHLLVSPSNMNGAGALMKSLGERYVQYINRRHGRTGTLWEGRYRSCLVQSERYLMECHRYIELNPVRAGMVSDPLQYPWSSYRSNAYGEQSAIVTPHELYNELGADSVARACAYREICSEALPDEMVERIRKVTQSNVALGDSTFTDDMADLIGRSMIVQDGGRPRRYY
jgi:putative transposase